MVDLVWKCSWQSCVKTGSIWYIYQGPQQILSADCDTLSLTFISGAKVLGSYLYNNTCITGHAGHFKTLKMVLQNYWWPQMLWYIGLYVKMCDLCNWMELQHCWPSGELQPSETPEEWWDVVSINFVVGLPDSHSYDVIMNIVDNVSKQAHSIPTHTMINAERATQLYLWAVWKHHGLPRAVLSDWGSQFIAEFTHELYQLLEIKLATSMAYTHRLMVR
jgi:hypothetical protein